MDHSVIQVTWATPDHRDVTRQIAIPYEIDRLISELQDATNELAEIACDR